MSAVYHQPQAGPPAERPECGRRKTGGLLEPLGIVGLEAIEPVLLAALISEDPLLLIGPHGTGKSFALERIARALHLSWRHYNASLLNYDDLVGYPLPNARGELEFVRTPASIWDAEAVFLDEIARCRPELQNKLFPVIHERRVQGIALEKLVYRWAAMNPPPADPLADDPPYSGSEPLDVALADRFAFIVTMPDWHEFSADVQERLLVAGERPVPPAAAQALAQAVRSGREHLRALAQASGAELVRYARIAADLCREAGLAVSPRRAVLLRKNVLAVQAARLAADPLALLEESAWLALAHALPQAAWGPPPSAAQVHAVHRQAWQAASIAEDADPARRLWLLRDPVLRAAAAARLPALANQEFSALVADALAALPDGGRHALAAWLFEVAGGERLVAAVAEQAASLYARVVEPPQIRETVAGGHLRHRTWQAITASLAARAGDAGQLRRQENLLIHLFAEGAVTKPADADRILDAWTQAVHKLQGAGA